MMLLDILQTTKMAILMGGKVMKVYRVWVDKYDYDEYDSCVVVAANEDNARENN